MLVGKSQPINAMCEMFSVLSCLVKQKRGKISLLAQLVAQVQTKMGQLFQRQQL